MINKKNEEVAAILSRLESVAPVFHRIYLEARRNSNYYIGEQWTQEERNSFLREGREPHVWNKIYSYINNIIGMQIQTRTDYTVIPVEKTDEKLAEVLLYLLKWASAVNELDSVETEVFLHGLLCGFSCTQVRWELSDFWGGYPKVERIPSYQMMWDVTDHTSSLSQARWLARVIPMTEEDLLDNFPTSIVKKIRSAGSKNRWGRLPFYSYLTYNQQMLYYMTGNYYKDLPYFVFEYYERCRKPRYTVVDLLFNNGLTFDSEKKAEEYLAGLLSEYSQMPEVALQDEEGNDLVYISEGYTDIITQSIIVGDTLIEQRETHLTDYPFQFYFPSNVDGAVYSPVSVLVPPQRFLNRLLTEWDNILGRTSRGMLAVIESLLPRGWSAERIAKLRSQTAPVIPVLRENAIIPIADHVTTPDIPNLINVVTQFMLEAGGGANILGLQENAAESGKSVRARQAAAGMARVPLFYGLQQWKKRVSNYLIWSMQENLTRQQVMRILGRYLDEEFFNTIEDQFDTLMSIKVDVNLTVAIDAESAREEMYNQLQQLISSGAAGALSPQTVLYLLLELNPAIPAEIKKTVYEMEPVIKEVLQKISEQQRQAEIERQGIEGAQRALIRKEYMEKNVSQQEQDNG